MPTILTCKDAIVFFEAAAAVAGFITWHKWKGSYLKWVPMYLLALVICECGGYYFGLAKNYTALKALYMYFVIPLEVSFICWLFFNSCISQFKKIIPYLWAVYFVLMLAENFYFTGSGYVFMSLSYTVGNAVILVLVLQYFIRLTGSDEILYFKTNIMFWLAAGMLVFYLGTFPYYGLYNVMAQKSMGSFMNYTWVMIFLNYTMYLLFTAGFIWGKLK